LKLTINEYYDDQTGEYIATKFYIDGAECSEDDYDEMLDALGSIDKCDCDCEECPGESNWFLRATTDAVNDTLEMFEDPNTCDDCKFQALMDLVTMGVDGALQGYIVRKDDDNGRYLN
jgi:hypothetical protein